LTGDEFSVILFHATSHAVRAEKVIQASGISCKMIPVPRQLSSDCGSCVRVRRSHKQAAIQALAAAGVEIEGVHDV
jgi:ribosomal protein S11